MGKKRQTVQAAAGAGSLISWREKRFIIEYLDNGNNGTRAYLKAWRNKVTYGTAQVEASRLLSNPIVQQAMAHERERRQKVLNFDRDEALRSYLAIARARMSDFDEVIEDPTNPEAYSALDDAELAIKSATKSYKTGNKVELYDRMAALNELWEKLGLGKASSAISWTDKLDTVLQVIGRIEKRKPT